MQNRYYDEKKNKGNYSYSLTATRTNMPFSYFMQKLFSNNQTLGTYKENNNMNSIRATEDGDDIKLNTTNNNDNNKPTNPNTEAHMDINNDQNININRTYYYMQHPFGGHTPKKLEVFGVKEALKDDIFSTQIFIYIFFLGLVLFYLYVASSIIVRYTRI